MQLPAQSGAQEKLPRRPAHTQAAGAREGPATPPTANNSVSSDYERRFNITKPMRLAPRRRTNRGHPSPPNNISLLLGFLSKTKKNLLASINAFMLPLIVPFYINRFQKKKPDVQTDGRTAVCEDRAAKKQFVSKAFPFFSPLSKISSSIIDGGIIVQPCKFTERCDAPIDSLQLIVLLGDAQNTRGAFKG